MKFNASNFILCTVGAFGFTMLAACGDENSTEVVEADGMVVVAEGETLPECGSKNSGDMIYVADSAAVYYCVDNKWTAFVGEIGGQVSKFDVMSCSAEQNEKTKDLVISCKTNEGKSVSYTIKNGADGDEGKSAYEIAKAAGYKGTETEWLASLKGDTGMSCSAAQNEDKTETTLTCQVENGSEVSYVVKNGSQGNSCSVTASEEGAVISCDGSGDVVVKNGEVGAGCTISEVKNRWDFVFGYDLICGKDNKKMGTVWIGSDGRDGTTCSIKDLNNGEVEVTCGSQYPVKLYKSMCGNKSYDPENHFCDDRDNQVYGYASINLKYDYEDETKRYNETWMAENLNYAEGEIPSWCGGGFNDEEPNCSKYGRLYTWNAAKSACPVGWHLPSEDEWNNLLYAVLEKNNSSLDAVGKYLKSKDGWGDDTESSRGNDAYGFTALPAGGRNEDGTFVSYSTVSYYTTFWSSTNAQNESEAEVLFLRSLNAGALLLNGNKNYGYSVRCVQDKEIGICGSKTYDVAKSWCWNEIIVTDSTIIDTRDGSNRKYKILTLEGENYKETWMAENLDYNTNAEGVTNSWCGGGNDKTEGDCSQYGRLYTWEAASSACPDGWQLPSREDWQALFDVVGKNESYKLKSSSGWENHYEASGNGKDAFGFSVLPAGFKIDNEQYPFQGVGNSAHFWTNTPYERNSNEIYYFAMTNKSKSAEMMYTGKDPGYSVRCIKAKSEQSASN